MDHFRKQYLENVLLVLQKIEKLILYSIEKDKVEYRIVVTNKNTNIEPNEEWRIVKQLSRDGIVSEYDEVETYKAQVGVTVLDPIMVFFLIIDMDKLLQHRSDIQQQLRTISNAGEDLPIWNKCYGWKTNKCYKAKNEIYFSNITSKVFKIFEALVIQEGGWVLSTHLITLLNSGDSQQLRSHLSQLRKKLVGTGLAVRARKDLQKPSAYRIEITS